MGSLAILTKAWRWQLCLEKRPKEHKGQWRAGRKQENPKFVLKRMARGGGDSGLPRAADGTCTFPDVLWDARKVLTGGTVVQFLTSLPAERVCFDCPRVQPGSKGESNNYTDAYHIVRL